MDVGVYVFICCTRQHEGDIPMILQVIRFIVRQVQSRSSGGTQRNRPRVQPGSKILLLSSTPYVIVGVHCISSLAIVLVRGLPREGLTFFRLERGGMERRVSSGLLLRAWIGVFPSRTQYKRYLSFETI